MLDSLVSRHLLDPPPYLFILCIDKQPRSRVFMCVRVAHVIVICIRLVPIERKSTDQRRRIVSPRSAAASWPRRDVNVAPIAANAVPNVARGSDGPVLWYTPKGVNLFCPEGGGLLSAREGGDRLKKGAYMQCNMKHRNSGCRSSTERRRFCGTWWSER